MTTYDGTVTISDPHLVERWEDEIEGHTVFLRYDDSPENPRSWYEHATALVATSSHYIEPDGSGDSRHAAVRHAMHYRGLNPEFIERYLRMFHDAAGFDTYDTGNRGEHTVIGWITREDAEREGIVDPQAAVVADLREYAQWASGEVYGVTVVRNEDGAEASLWGVYDEYPFEYVLSVARDLVGEVE